MTENELLDLYKTLAYLPNDAEGNPLTPFGNFCAGYEAHAELADKQIAELISDIETYVKISGDQATEIVELQAQINELREALEDISKLPYTSYKWGTIAAQAIAKTASQCLIQHDNEVIERCAKVADYCWFEYGSNGAKTIRALKVNQND